MSGLKTFFVMSGLAALTACADSDARPEPGKTKVYTGVYMTAHEVSFFIPSGVPEHWWVDPPMLDASSIPVSGAPGFPDARVMHLKVRGRVSEFGNWGHLGGQQRELAVADVLELSPATHEEFELAQCTLPYPDWAPEDARQTALEACRRLEAQ